jgi:hypothetical protein
MKLIVSESYRKKLSELGFNQLTDGGSGGGDVLGVTVNLLMCDIGGALYSVYARVSNCLYIILPPPKMRKYKYDVNFTPL